MFYIIIQHKREFVKGLFIRFKVYVIKVFESEAAAERGGFFVFGFGFESVSLGGDVAQYVIYKLRSESASFAFRSNIFPLK